jgi:hypothetical protein
VKSQLLEMVPEVWPECTITARLGDSLAFAETIRVPGRSHGQGKTTPGSFSMFFDPRQRGYSVLYHEGENMHCPGCGRCNWNVGRSMAECAFCTTALPIAEGAGKEVRPMPVPGSYAELSADSPWQRSVIFSLP